MSNLFASAQSGESVFLFSALERKQMGTVRYIVRNGSKNLSPIYESIMCSIGLGPEIAGQLIRCFETQENPAIPVGYIRLADGSELAIYGDK